MQNNLKKSGKNISTDMGHDQETSKNTSKGEYALLIGIVSGIIMLIIQLQQSYRMQKSTIWLIPASLFFLLALIFWNRIQRLEGNRKMRKKIMIITIILLVMGLAGCATFFFTPQGLPEDQLLDIFENRNLNGSIVLAFYNGSKGKDHLVNNVDQELKVVVFRKNDDSIEIIYSPEIHPSGITIMSELPEGEYCIGISFFGIILDYVEQVYIDHNRVEFIELIRKNPQGIVKFEAVDPSDNPLSGIIFQIKSSSDEPLREWETGNDGKTIDFWVYSLSEKSIGSYYAIAMVRDENGNEQILWCSENFRPHFNHVGDKYSTIRAVIKIPDNIKKH